MFVDLEIKLARPIEEADMIFASYSDIADYYIKSDNFIGLGHYPSTVKLLDGEMGYLAIILGKVIFPIVRVIQRR